MHARLIMAGILGMAWGLGTPPTAWAHEGEHDAGQEHRQEQSRFLEGSGSTVFAPPPGAQEYSDEYGRRPEDGSPSRADYREGYEKKDHRGNYRDHRGNYEEDSGGMKSQHPSPQPAPTREGSGP
ncbi:MAG: hypothetical protein ACE5ER_07315 [Nitrospinaceae bacterium]